MMSGCERMVEADRGLRQLQTTTLDSVILGKQVTVVRLTDVRRLLVALCAEATDVVPLCPVCGKPATVRAWCSAECERADTNKMDPRD